jgi:biotin carboxyl carrier protein
MATRVLSIVFFVVALFLGYYLFNSIKSRLDEEKRIERVEKNVIDKLKLIRDTEIAFQLLYGRYTSNWDSLVNFLQSGTIYITDRKEEIIPKEYGDEEVIVHVDTVGTVPAREYVFTSLNLVAAPDSGTVVSINVKEGDEVTIGHQMYSMQTTDKLLRYKSEYNGKITNVNCAPGMRVRKGNTLIEILNYKYPLTTDINRLPFIPGSGKKFSIYANKINKNGVWVDVFEVKDIDPVNPERRANNNEKALRVGSREEVSTSGNWE